jgi:formyltetrahydrofolate deformylase
MNDQDARDRGLVLLLSCKNQPGIVAAISTHLYEAGYNIRASQQFDDVTSGRLFARLEFEPVDDQVVSAEQAAEGFAPVADRFQMEWSLQPADVRMRVLIMVSRYGHCLNDLLYRTSIGALRIEIPAIVSNHRDTEPLAAHYGIPFHHVPVTPETKPQAEGRLLELIAQEGVELTVLARYMQILSPELSHALSGRAINIHHSMLPSFKGARPYYQAFDRGVKMVGATSHYVTDDLDEGPIIDQEIARVDHTMNVAEITALGRDAECRALARAVRWHTESRVVVNGHRTVVFR